MVHIAVKGSIIRLYATMNKCFGWRCNMRRVGRVFAVKTRATSIHSKTRAKDVISSTDLTYNYMEQMVLIV